MEKKYSLMLKVKILGKQRTSVLSRKAEMLYNSNPAKFSEKIDNNKAVLTELGIFSDSKTNRNIMAGYITRIVKRGPSVK